MNKIFNLGSVDQYNKLYGLETLNPLVSVINLNKATRQMNYAHWHYGIYALYLKLEKACDIRYGRQNYDYQEGTIVCFAPGQDAETTLITDRVQVNALGILFHPDLLLGTSLGKTIKKYTFFSYEVNEALHLSEEERNIIMDCLRIIRLELEHGVDKHSKTLLVNYIELLLNYCMRFYERQFVTRSKANHDVLTRFEQLLDNMPFPQLLRRYGKERNRQDTTGTYSGKSNRNGKGTYDRHRRYSQPDCLLIGIPVPAAFLPPVQKTGRMYS